MATYEVKNDHTRPQGFRVRGGMEVVRAGQTRVLELADEYTPEAIASMKARGVTLKEATTKAENADTAVEIGKPLGERPNMPVSRRARRGRAAETGGVEPRSTISENGGVDRDPEDTTTTTAPTEKQIGPKA